MFKRPLIETTLDRNDIRSIQHLIKMTIDKKKIYFCMFLRLNNLFVAVH